MGGGIVGMLVPGAVMGAGIALAGPAINSYVPQVGPFSPTTVAVLGGGLAAKMVLHKGGNFASAAVTLGAAMAAQNLLAGSGGNGGGMTYY